METNISIPGSIWNVEYHLEYPYQAILYPVVKNQTLGKK